jgi:hypothetical protein
VTEAVVGGPLLIVIEHLVGLLGFLEAVLGGVVVGISIGVVLHCKAAVGLLQVIGRCIPVNTQYFVVVSLAHSTALFDTVGSVVRVPFLSMQTAASKAAGCAPGQRAV